MKHLSLAADVARAPAATYARLLTRDTSAYAGALPGRLLMLAVLNGVVLSLIATGRVGLVLAVSMTAYWLPILLLQLTAALGLVLLAGSRQLRPSAALSLLFLGHLPWSVWTLCLAAALTIAARQTPPSLVIPLTALVPLIWTAVIIEAFCRTVLGMSSTRARIATVLHQGVLWGVVAIGVWWTSGGWARFPGLPGQ
jgi:hypothetical protein